MQDWVKFPVPKSSRILFGKLVVPRQLGNLCIYRWITFKRILKKQGVTMWTGSGISGGYSEQANQHLGSITGGKHHGHVTDSHILKDSVPWRYQLLSQLVRELIGYFVSVDEHGPSIFLLTFRHFSIRWLRLSIPVPVSPFCITYRSQSFFLVLKHGTFNFVLISAIS